MTTELHDDNRNEPPDQIERHGFVDGWRSIFSFTAIVDLPVLLPAILCSVAAGCLQPATAFFFGRFFDTFSGFVVGDFDGQTFMAKSLGSFSALFAVAAATFLLKGTLFSLWLIFGELQARRARELLFASLLDRNIEWYEAQRNGVGTVLMRIQR
jgi:ATP-binding cassette, subfamily B (MDR/TAP), member 1